MDCNLQGQEESAGDSGRQQRVPEARRAARPQGSSEVSPRPGDGSTSGTRESRVWRASGPHALCLPLVGLIAVLMVHPLVPCSCPLCAHAALCKCSPLGRLLTPPWGVRQPSVGFRSTMQ